MTTRFAATQYTQKKALDHLLGITSWTMPTTYFGLATSSPGETGVLTGEAAGGSYARQALAAKMAATVLGTGFAISNVLLQFPILSADLGTATDAFVADALSAGNVLFYAALEESAPLFANDLPVQFAPGDISISLEDANLTNYARKAILDHALGITSFTKPTAVYLGLFTSNPGASGSLTGEVAIGSYARVEITSKMAAAVLGTGIATSNADITFPAPTAAWETIAYLGVMDASTSGNVLFYTPLRRAFVVNSGDPATVFEAGRLGFRMQ